MSAVQAVEDVTDALPHDGEALSAANPSIQRVAAMLDRAAVPYSLRMLPHPTTQPDEIAAAFGCDVKHVAVPVLLRGKTTKKPFLIIHSASTVVKDRLLGQMVGENLQRADPDFVLRYTGYPDGCVPPVGLLNRVPVLLDIHLTPMSRILCPSGSPDAVFAVSTIILARAIAARVVQFN